LGRGIVCVTLPNLGGVGPTLEPAFMQREVDKAEVNKLFKFFGGQEAQNLCRLEPIHELVIGVSKEAIDLDTLTQDTSGPFPDVKFLLGAGNSVAKLYAGQHRIEALKLILEPTISELGKVEKKLANKPDNTKLVDQQLTLRANLKKMGTWLVAFHDIGKLLLSIHFKSI
jgi:hypothetical protein